MTAETKPQISFLSRIASNLALGLLVSVLSVLTALANYMAYQSGGTASGYEADGDRLLATSNTLYLQANQAIIIDYDMYDGFVINAGVDEFNTQYYLGQFSSQLQASIDRDDIWDDQYYNEMYAEAATAQQEALALFEQANTESAREGGFQLSMLIAAVGLAFAAYASLLNETNRLRSVFALLSILLMAFSALQFFTTLLA